MAAQDKLGRQRPRIRALRVFRPEEAWPLSFHQSGSRADGLRRPHPCDPRPGELVVLLGGHTGRDGLHGATMSSGSLDRDYNGAFQIKKLDGPLTLYNVPLDRVEMVQGNVTIMAEEIVVRLSKRAHNPLVTEAGLTQRTGAVPWLGGRGVRIECP